MNIMAIVQHPLVLFVLGCLVTYVFHRLQKNHRRISYQCSDSIVIDPRIREEENLLEVRYGGNVVPQVTRTVIRFWNSGTETINGNDVSGADPFRWQLPENAAFLATNIDRTTRAANLISIDKNGNNLLLKFDFLDPHDGATISILHTAVARNSSLRGTIKGMKGKISSQGGMSEIPNFPPMGRMPEKSNKNGIGRWIGRALALFVFFATLFGIAYALAGFFPDYFLDNIPYIVSEEPSAPEVVRGKINIDIVLKGLLFTVVFGLISAAIVSNWRNKPPAKLRLDS
ncbi:MAG: hypothetical protein EOP92_19855 [Lysobacteraceae bacterium]|nr:MAG: hypothetical protein EOP92_19855 [Xanthomonadaceae bacterium]